MATVDRERPVRLIEVRSDASFTFVEVIGMQLLDTAVHTWDVATSIGLDFRPEPDIVDAVYLISGFVPEGPARDVTRAFRQPTPTRSTDQWDQALAHLGRRVMT